MLSDLFMLLKEPELPLIMLLRYVFNGSLLDCLFLIKCIRTIVFSYKVTIVAHLHGR